MFLLKLTPFFLLLSLRIKKEENKHPHFWRSLCTLTLCVILYVGVLAFIGLHMNELQCNDILAQKYKSILDKIYKVELGFNQQLKRGNTTNTRFHLNKCCILLLHMKLGLAVYSHFPVKHVYDSFFMTIITNPQHIVIALQH